MKIISLPLIFLAFISYGLFQPPSGVTTFTPLHTYFMAATGCSDANAGTSTASPWCTPNHSVVCGDVIVAKPGSYTNDFHVWGTVSTCPSVSGGIDGTGGIYAAIVLCGGSEISSSTTNSCVVNCASAPCNSSVGIQAGISVEQSNWAVEGWYINGNGINSYSGTQALGCSSVNTYISFINMIVVNGGQAFTPQPCGNFTGTVGADFVSVVGMIAQNSSQSSAGGICVAAIDVVGVGVSGSSTTVTRYFVYNNFAFNSFSSGCLGPGFPNYDSENYMVDSIDGEGAKGKYILANNIGYYAMRNCMNFTNGGTTGAPTIRFYNNTCYDNMQHDGNTGDNADILINSPTSAMFWNISMFNNIGYQPNATPALGGGGPLYELWTAPQSISGTFLIGAQYTTGAENIFKATQTICDVGSVPLHCNSGFDVQQSNTGQASYGTNTYINPDFKNTTDLISNHIGVPNCAGFENTTQCMGYNASTNTMTSLSVLDDLTPNATSGCSQCAGKGFQLPSTTCLSSGEVVNDFPNYLKGLVYLHAVSGFTTGTVIQQKQGLATTPCGL